MSRVQSVHRLIEQRSAWLLWPAICVSLSAIGCYGAEGGARDRLESKEAAVSQKVVAPASSPTQLASSGTTARSAHYQMTFSLGGPMQNQNPAKSQNYQVQGGAVLPVKRLK